MIIKTLEQLNSLLAQEPNLKSYIKYLIGAEEYINNKIRWCLWLKGANPNEIGKSLYLKKQIQKVKDFRLNSKKEATRKLANMPSLFAEIKDIGENYLLIPLTSSERRKYIPLGFLSNDYIPTNSCSIIPHATLYEFGVLTSIMHMTWMKYVCGRLESRYRYSNKIVYNNFPWPLNPSEKQKEKVKELAQKVLDVRAKYPDCSLAILYNPETMPADLTKAHNELDKAVDACYGKKSFTSDVERMEFLFNLYEQYTVPLTNKAKGRKK